MTAEQVANFFALAIGFAVAGLVASAYQLVTCRPASFRLLGEGPASVVAVPLIGRASCRERVWISVGGVTIKERTARRRSDRGGEAKCHELARASVGEQ